MQCKLPGTGCYALTLGRVLMATSRPLRQHKGGSAGVQVQDIRRQRCCIRAGKTCATLDTSCMAVVIHTFLC